MTKQLAFDWPTGVSLGPDDFFVSSANAQAFTMVQAPDTWPDAKLVLTGPKGSGKSHLARIFQSQTNADIMPAHKIRPSTAAHIIVEDVDQLPPEAEEPLFHLHNNRPGTLLMTAQTPPTRWNINLPDLASRMQATSIAHISNPDDALLSALLMKLFADRQIMPPPNVISYLAPRIERSFAAAAAIVDQLDQTALAERRSITQRMAARLLDNSG